MGEALRQIKPLILKGISPAEVSKDIPKFAWVDPCSLYIEPSYQRDVSKASAKMITRIVAEWDWTKVKPPICARDEKGRLFVMDGQHTAIAAASHPDITAIPVLIVKADTTKQRAVSFLSHNRDRVNVTSLHVYYAAVEAGDPMALAMKEACEKAKTKILRCPPAHATFNEGELMAVTTLRMIVKAKGSAGGARVMKILKNAGRIPIGAGEMKAVFYFLYTLSKNAGHTMSDDDLSEIIVSHDQRHWYDIAKEMRASDKSVTVPLGIAMTWFKAFQARRNRTA